MVPLRGVEPPTY